MTLKDDLQISEILHFSNAEFSKSRELPIAEVENVIDESNISSTYFRYRGERLDAREYLERIDPSLLRPLKLLREQYHLLERSL